MSLVETWVETPLAGATGWALLDSLWEGAIIAAALAAVLMVLRSPRARYAAACAAMLAMLGAFGFTLARAMPGDGARVRIQTAPEFPWNVPAIGAPGPLHTDLAAVVPWLAPFWVGGVWIFYLGHATGWISVYRLRRRGVCCAPAQWQEAVGRLSARLRVSRPVALLESCLADAPVVLGHWRPVILTPVGMLAGLPAGQVEAILLHELAHIRRWDYLVNACQRLVEGVFFYHPAVWWISGVIRAERENCCDDVAVAASGDAHEYAVALAALEQERCSGRSPAVAATGGSLVKRIRRLLYPKGPNGAWTPLLAALVLMVTAALALTAWQSAPGPPTETSPYMKWLNEDVVYIIADRERAAFLKLTTDEERDKFIEQFWERRDPTPGAAENQFKKEHYRRLAFANRHYRTPSGGEGWRTDRGHMYIVYGPPDEIESHPAHSLAQYPFEAWMYHHIQGIGDHVTITFVDRTGTGDYRFAPGKGY